jgi:hypothetical protein
MFYFSVVGASWDVDAFHDVVSPRSPAAGIGWLHTKAATADGIAVCVYRCLTERVLQAGAIVFSSSHTSPRGGPLHSLVS